MALKLGTLDVDLEINTKELDKAENKVNKSTKAMTASFNKLGGVLSGLFATQQIVNMIKVTDQMRVLEGRIKRVTKSAEGFDKAWKAINKSADEAGVSINDSAASFERFLMATQSMGASIDDVAKFNDLILKTGRISGASATELSNALTQLSQGFSGGIIRAEEWNSIMEQAPEILRVAAKNIKGVDGDLGKLRKVMLAGELTSAKFFNAFMEGANGIETEFAKIPKSVEQNMQALSNQFTRLLTNIDKTLGLTQKLAAGFGALADGLNEAATEMVIAEASVKKYTSSIGKLNAERELLLKNMGMVSQREKADSNNRIAAIDAQIVKEKELLSVAQEGLKKVTPKEEDKAFSPLAPTTGGGDNKSAKRLAKQKEDAQDVLDDIKFRTSETADQIEMIWSENLDQIDALKSQGLINEAEHLEAQKLLNIEYLDEIDQLEKEAADKRNERNQQQVDSIAQMSTAISSTLSSISSDSDSGLAKTANAFSVFAKSIIATSQAMAAAQALADPTALTLPQKLANYATILTSFASISSMMAGGRVNGGSMQEGSMYAINEGGKSEILEEGGKQFLLAGKNAKVTGNGAMKESSGGNGGGGGMSVSNVFNITGTDDELNKKLAATVEQSVRQSQAMYVQQMTQKNGKMYTANTQTYGPGRTNGRPT
jgi:tape measure domain-containing protein